MASNMYVQFLGYDVGEFLAARHLQTTGVKQELVARCFVAWEQTDDTFITEGFKRGGSSQKEDRLRQDIFLCH